MATIAVSGASGFVGSALSAALREGGHRVRPLVRPGRPPGPDAIAYDPGSPLPADQLEGVDAVVHLAGESIASGRWTTARKRELRQSRVATTETLAAAMSALGERAPRWVSASAIGYYGDRGDAWVDEDTGAGSGFLAELCVDWEAATAPAVRAGASVVQARIGMVLGAGGGTLQALLPLFKLGLGGRIGDGRQWMSWICLGDLVRALMRLALDRSLTGPVNLTAPEPVTNADFTRALAERLGRPAVLPVPGPLARLGLGQFAEEALLAGQRVRCARLQQADFRFDAPTLERCLSACL